MKAWELMEQLQGRDPSGPIIIHLEGNRRIGTELELSPPSRRKIEIEVALPDEEIEQLEQNVASLEGMVDDLQSALQNITKAWEVYQEDKCLPPLKQAIEDATEISTRAKP